MMIDAVPRQDNPTDKQQPDNVLPILQGEPLHTSDLPSIELYSLDDIATQLLRANILVDDEFSRSAAENDSNETKRIRLLLALLEKKVEGTKRTLLCGTHAMQLALEKVASKHPNFNEVSQIIARAVVLSLQTKTPLWLPPLILVGPPGIGKSRYARAIAAALATGFEEVAMNLLDDSATLVGHSTSWRTAKPGLVANCLLHSANASPMIILDELDKTQPHYSGDNPLDVLHSLLEAENARRFMDVYLTIPMRADHVLWIATANRIDAIPASILDRFLIVTIPDLTLSQRRGILRSIIYGIAADLPGFDTENDNEILDSLSHDISVRQLQRIVRLAFGYAAEAKRFRLATSDIARATLHCRAGEEVGHRPIGFMPRLQGNKNQF